MDYTALNNMCEWEQDKAIYLVRKAKEIGYDTKHAMVGVNDCSGYTWIWSEEEKISMYMPVESELKEEDITLLWTCPYCGEYFETDFNQYGNIDQLINDWEVGDGCKKCKGQ